MPSTVRSECRAVNHRDGYGLTAGYLVGLIGLRQSLLIFGGGYLLATLAPLVFPSWHEMDARRGRLDPAPAAS